MTTRTKHPFFIIGCVRSGTTLLRNVLRCHPRLTAPEETQFFRWPDPFGSTSYRNTLTTSPTLKKHRQLDGIEEGEFLQLLNDSVTRADFCMRYMALFMERNKPAAARWFDKSPQNVYGAAMIATEFPQAKFIHIVRNPYDVVSSLRIGKVLKVASLVAACNYWNEAAEIVQVIKAAYPHRVYEVKYEEFTRELLPELEQMLIFLGEDFDPAHYQDIGTEPKRHDHGALFSDKERSQIARFCLQMGVKYGYLPATNHAL